MKRRESYKNEKITKKQSYNNETTMKYKNEKTKIVQQ